MRPTIRGMVAVLTIAIIASGAYAGTYTDKKHGFSIKTMSGWSQTPTQPGEETEVAKFKDDRKGDFATLSIYRFEKTGASQTTTPGSDEKELPEIPELPRGFGMPDSAKEYLEQTMGRSLSRLKQIAERRNIDMEVPEFPEPKTVKFGKIEGDIYLFEVKAAPKLYFQGQFSMAGIIANDTEEYLIVYECAPNRARKNKNAFLSSIRSFRFPDGDGKTGQDDDDDPSGRVIGDPDKLIDLAKREKIKAELVGTWKYIDTPHYIVIYNCDRKLAAYIANRIEYMREHAFEKVFPPIKPIEECMVVRVCKEMDEYHHYGGPRGSAGYWASFKDELVFPDLSRSKKPDEKTIGVLHHEGFHQYIYYCLLKHNPPVWFNEGCAEYFFCVNSTGKRLSFEKRHSMRYGTVKSAVGTDSLIPLADFMKLSHGQYMARAQLCYSQGWAFITWMKNVTRNERYREIPNIYFNELQRGYAEAAEKAGDDPMSRFMGRDNKITKKALEKALEGIDMDEFNKDFLSDVKRKM